MRVNTVLYACEHTHSVLKELMNVKTNERKSVHKHNLVKYLSTISLFGVKKEYIQDYNVLWKHHLNEIEKI